MNITGKKVYRDYGKERIQGTIIAVSQEFEELRDGVGHYPVFVIVLDSGLVTSIPCSDSIIEEWKVVEDVSIRVLLFSCPKRAEGLKSCKEIIG